MIKHVFCFKKSLLNQKNDFFWLALASSLLQLQSKSVNAEGFSLELCPSDQISCDSLSFCGLNWSAPGIRSTWETPGTEIVNDSFMQLFPWSCFVLQECKTQDCTLVFLVEHHIMKRTQTILPAPNMLCTWGVSAFSLYCMSVCFVCFSFLPVPCVLSSPWRSKASALSSSAARSTSWSESNTFSYPFCYTRIATAVNETCQTNAPNMFPFLFASHLLHISGTDDSIVFFHLISKIWHPHSCNPKSWSTL